MMGFTRVVVLLSVVAGIHGRQLYDAQMKFDIDAACVGDDASHSPDSECHALCQRGACCFVTEEECSSDVECDLYESCAPVFSQASDALDPSTFDADDIKDACEDQFEIPSAPGQPTLCEAMCKAGECCYNDQDCDELTDGHDSNDHCLKYLGCWVLYEGGVAYDDDDMVETEDSDRNRNLVGGGLRSQL